MGDDIIGMREMGVIFDLTDGYGIDREQISVPLEKEDPGAVRKLSSGEIEVVVPLSVPIEEWAGVLKGGLEEMGFTWVGDGEDDE